MECNTKTNHLAGLQETIMSFRIGQNWYKMVPQRHFKVQRSGEEHLPQFISPLFTNVFSGMKKDSTSLVKLTLNCVLCGVCRCVAR